jgi:hypothetical protein
MVALRQMVFSFCTLLPCLRGPLPDEGLALASSFLLLFFLLFFLLSSLFFFSFLEEMLCLRFFSPGEEGGESSSSLSSSLEACCCCCSSSSALLSATKAEMTFSIIDFCGLRAPDSRPRSSSICLRHCLRVSVLWAWESRVSGRSPICRIWVLGIVIGEYVRSGHVLYVFKDVVLACTQSLLDFSLSWHIFSKLNARSLSIPRGREITSACQLHIRTQSCVYGILTKFMFNNEVGLPDS